MKLRDLPIGVRLYAGLSIVLGLVVCLFVLTLTQTSRSRTATVEALGSVLQQKTEVAQAKDALLEAAVSMRNVGLLVEVTDTQREEASIKATRKQLALMLKTMSGETQSAEARALLEALQQNETRLDAPVAEALAQAMAFNPEGAVKVINSKIDPLYRDSLTKMTALAQIADRHAVVIAEESAQAAAGVLRVLLGAGLATIATVVVLAVLLARSITLPIRRAVAIARKVAAGDLSGTIAVDRRDETGELLESLRTMSEQLKNIVGQVLESADSIATSTAQVSAGNLDLSARTEEAASVSQQTVSAIEKLGATVRTNAVHARDASSLADTAAGVARQGGEVVNEVVSTMGRISQASRKIADIISVIDGIAFQTNILALNAAVEAARAGEQGRGFAVVASEVRSLAQRSTTAAREIKQLIAASVESVESGAALVGRAGTTMTHIVTSVQGFHDIVRSVSAASDEQTQGIEEVKGSMTQIDDATQRNAALVEEAAAASNSLQAQAMRLRESMSTFRV